MAGRRVLALERRDGLGWLPQLDLCRPANQRQRLGELIDIDLPVAAALQVSAARSQRRKHRMPLPAPPQVADLGPGVGIQHVMAIHGDAIRLQHPPDVDQVRTRPGEIGRHRAVPPILAPGQPLFRLIHADHKVPGERRGQAQGALPHATAGIQDQRGRPGLLPLLQCKIQRAPARLADGLAKGLGQVAGHARREVVVDIGLGRGDGAGVGEHGRDSTRLPIDAGSPGLAVLATAMDKCHPLRRA